MGLNPFVQWSMYSKASWGLIQCAECQITGNSYPFCDILLHFMFQLWTNGKIILGGKLGDMVFVQATLIAFIIVALLSLYLFDKKKKLSITESSTILGNGIKQWNKISSSSQGSYI